MTTTYTYALDPKKVEVAIGILDQELNVLNSYKQASRELTVGWRVSISYYFIGAAAVILLLINHGWLLWELGALFVYGFLFVMFLLTLPALIRSVRNFRKLRHAQRDLGVDPVRWLIGWKEAKARLPWLLLFYFGLGLVSAAIALDVGAWLRDALWVLAALCFLLFQRMMHKRQLIPVETRIREANALREVLVSGETSPKPTGGVSTISLSDVDYKVIARIERVLIERDRKQTVKDSLQRQAGSVWPVRRSASVTAKLLALETAVQLRIQARIDELTMHPEPSDATKDTDDNHFVQVSQTDWAISYRLVRNPRWIMIRDLLEITQSPRLYEARNV